MALAGLRGTGSFSSDERPKNYRGVLLLLKPNTRAPLTAMTGVMKSEPTDDVEFKVFTKGLPAARAVVSASVNTTVTTVTLITGTQDNSIFRTGHAVMNERTGEVMWVASKSGTGSIIVERAKGSTATAMTANDGIFILSTTHEDGADTPAAVTYPPAVVTNYAQIFRNSLNLTGTALATRLRYADNPKVEMKREILELHATEIEKQFLFGSGVEDTTGSQPQWTTKGMYYFLTSNVQDFADAVDIDTLENALEDIFEDGSDEKMLYCGNRLLNVINKGARIWGSLDIMPTSETFGMQIMRWVTSFGTLMLRQHPLLSKNPTFNDWGFVVDNSAIVYRYVRGRDTQYLTNRQGNGEDIEKDEFFTHAGLECQFEEVHGLFKNGSTFVP